MKKGSLWKALLWFVVGFVLGFLAYRVFVLPNFVEAKGKKITICHKPGKLNQTLRINSSAWKAHKAHGDYKGKCRKPKPTPTPPICEWSEWSECRVDVCGDGYQVRYLRGEGCSNEEDKQKCHVECEPTPTPEPTPEPKPEPRTHGGASAPPVCEGRDLGGYAPTITEVGRIDADTVWAKWTPSTENADHYVVWFGLSEDNLPWNTIVQGEYVELNDVPNTHIWLKVAATDLCVVGNFSETVDP